MFKKGDKVKIDEKCSKYWWYTTETLIIIDMFRTYTPSYVLRQKYILNTIVGNSNSKYEFELRHLNQKELRKEKLEKLNDNK